jgi:hypothetical protein
MTGHPECADARARGPFRDPLLERPRYVVDCAWHGVSGRYLDMETAEAHTMWHRAFYTRRCGHLFVLRSCSHCLNYLRLVGRA